MPKLLTLERELEIIKELEQFDSATISNVVATFPGKNTCLSLYHPWDVNWYTNDTIKVMYPEMGATCGYAVTCTYGLPDPGFKNGPGFGDILRAVGNSPKPAIIFIKQDFPENIKRKNGLCGGNMATAYKSAGCVGIVSDGPSRDIDEVREIGIQYMITGTAAAHGNIMVKAVNTPVEICGMDVCPGEIVHMDVNGAVKFPREYLEEILENCNKLRVSEAEKMRMLASTSDVELLAKYMVGVYD